jgi:hypothetical protein
MTTQHSPRTTGCLHREDRVLNEEIVNANRHQAAYQTQSLSYLQLRPPLQIDECTENQTKHADHQPDPFACETTPTFITNENAHLSAVLRHHQHSQIGLNWFALLPNFLRGCCWVDLFAVEASTSVESNCGIHVSTRVF